MGALPQMARFATDLCRGSKQTPTPYAPGVEGKIVQGVTGVMIVMYGRRSNGVLLRSVRLISLVKLSLVRPPLLLRPPLVLYVRIGRTSLGLILFLFLRFQKEKVV